MSVKRLFQSISFWLKCARVYSLPVTVMSWLVVFVWAYKSGGNIFNGILALIGISFAHLATNLFDDYSDYKILCKDEKYMSSAQICKCAYLRDGIVSHNDLLKAVVVFCAIAFVIGVALTLTVGLPVVWLALVGAVIVLVYGKLSVTGFGELAVFIAFGPLLFEGVYYVMTGSFSLDVLILSLAVVMVSEGLLYSHMLLDYDGDLTSHKKTLCCQIGDKNKALKLLYYFYVLGYLSIAVLAFRTMNFYLFATYLTIPLAIAHYSNMKKYNADKTYVPEIHWWNYPLDNWENIIAEGSASFYFGFFQARNIMMYFSLILTMAILI